MEVEEYKKHIEYEKNFYSPDIYKDDLTEKANEGLTYFLGKVDEKIRNQVGLTVWDYVISAVNKKQNLSSEPLRILSLGSGPGGAEMNLAKDFVVNYIFDCIDINKKMLDIGKESARKRNLNMNFIQQDINEIILPKKTYDIVFAHASLHHLLNHEHVCTEIRKTMKDNAEFIVFDVIARNGMRMWDETREIANKLWTLLPSKYKNNQNSNENQLVDTLQDKDLSVDGFECIRSQDLYPILKNNFKTKIEVMGYSFARRFVDGPCGNNYDIKNNPFDKAILDTIISLDEEYTKKFNLKAEQVFLVLIK